LLFLALLFLLFLFLLACVLGFRLGLAREEVVVFSVAGGRGLLVEL
jgi:hypothetical protein